MEALGIILGILSIIVLITLHEFAHFVCAKLSGVYVYEFSVGLGPKLFSWGKKETKYVIRAIPLGGFVSLASIYIDPPEDRVHEKVPEAKYMESAKFWKKLLFIVAGALANFFIAVFIFSTMYAAIGYKPKDASYWGAIYNTNGPLYKALLKTDLPKNQDSAIVKYTFSYQTGSDPNDLKTSTWNGWNFSKKIPTYLTTVEQVLKNLKIINNAKPSKAWLQQITFRQIQSNGKLGATEEVNSDQAPQKNGFPLLEKNHVFSVGMSAPNRYFSSTAQAYGYGWKDTFQQSVSILVRMTKFSKLEGPVGIAKNAGNVVNYGAAFFFYYVGLLSANLFVLNLLPIPPLDGYKFWETIFEKITKRRIEYKTKLIINGIGVGFIACLVVGITIANLVI